MALKHLLNEDDVDQVYYSQRPCLSWSDYDTQEGYATEFEMEDNADITTRLPTLTAQPLDQCIEELLGSQSLRYDSRQEDTENNLSESFQEANDLMQLWTYDCQPCPSTQIDALPDQPYICYGTVSDPSHLQAIAQT